MGILQHLEYGGVLPSVVLGVFLQCLEFAGLPFHRKHYFLDARGLDLELFECGLLGVERFVEFDDVLGVRIVLRIAEGVVGDIDDSHFLLIGEIGISGVLHHSERWIHLALLQIVELAEEIVELGTVADVEADAHRRMHVVGVQR